jgi:hypothetical protein
VSFKLIDRGLLEILGPLGFVRFFSNIIKKISQLQSGLIYHYIFMMILGITFFLILFMFSIYLNTNLVLICIYLYIYLNLKIKDIK